MCFKKEYICTVENRKLRMRGRKSPLFLEKNDTKKTHNRISPRKDK